jgi:hypothetical protein
MPPLAPTFSGSTPASPSSSIGTNLRGAAEAGSTVTIHTTANCSDASNVTGSASLFASGGIGVSVVANTTTTFYATATDAAGNVSACSAGMTYRNDIVVPNTPSHLTTSPVSPSPRTALRLRGTAEAGSTVRVYTGVSCSGAPRATVSAASFASPGAPLSVHPNSTTSLRVTATDAAGNVSACSPALAYVSDSLPPATRLITHPLKSTTSHTAAFTFTSEARARFQCRLDSGAYSACTSPHTVTAGVGRHTFWVRAVDRAGNVDASPALFTWTVTRR